METALAPWLELGSSGALFFWSHVCLPRYFSIKAPNACGLCGLGSCPAAISKSNAPVIVCLVQPGRRAQRPAPL